jgi:hypothetical protein
MLFTRENEDKKIVWKWVKEEAKEEEELETPVETVEEETVDEEIELPPEELEDLNPEENEGL